MAKLNVAVLMGGTSSERDISLSTGRQILGALDSRRYNVCILDTPELPVAAAGDLPDVIVIALHGKGGEDGTIQGFLDTVGIPYTGSGVLASALAMDKARCKTFLAACGIRVPAGVVLSRSESRECSFGLPAVVKPVLQGSSDGVTIVPADGDLPKAIDFAFTFDETILIEEFVAGVEITCAVLGNSDLEALPLVEILPAKGFYDREAKYTPGATEEICPARLEPSVTAQAQQIALQCHRVLGCRGMSRTDMIVSPDGGIYVLEVNTIPGMTPTSLLPRAAATAGYTFSELLDRLIDLALTH